MAAEKREPPTTMLTATEALAWIATHGHDDRINAGLEYMIGAGWMDTGLDEDGELVFRLTPYGEQERAKLLARHDN